MDLFFTKIALMFISKSLSFLFDGGKQSKSIDESLKVGEISFNYLVLHSVQRKFLRIRNMLSGIFFYFKKVYESIK